MTGNPIEIRKHEVDVISEKNADGEYQYFLLIDGHRFLISQKTMKDKEDSKLKELLNKSIEAVEEYGTLVTGVL